MGVPPQIWISSWSSTESAAAEAKHDIYVGFWYIPRKYNAIADRLAKDAAKRAPTVLPARILIPTVVVAPPK